MSGKPGGALEQQLLVAQAQTRAVKREATINSITTSFWLYEPSATHSTAASEPTELVFVHGYRGTHAGLEAIAGALPEFKIFIPDLPGFGESEVFETAEISQSGNYSAEHYAKWLGDYVKQVSPNAVVVAHSFGTLVAAIAAAQGLLSNEKLVLINPVGQVERAGFNRLAKQVTNALYYLASKLGESAGKSLVSSKLVVRTMSVMMAKTRNRTLRNWIHAQHDANFSNFANLTVALDAYRSGESTFVNDVASKIRQKTLLVIGELDDITPVANQQILAQLFQQAETFEIASVGHLIHYETPQVAACRIREFLLSKN